ncbi:hypothetical protein ACLOJK_000642 [Asimina triloba]
MRRFQGRHLLLNDEVASPDHSDVATRSSDEPVIVRGLTETPHATAAQRSLLQKGRTPPHVACSCTGHGPGTGPPESPRFQGRRLLLNDEVASPDHSDVATRSSDEPVTLRGLTETPHVAAARRSLLQRGSIPPRGHSGPSAGGNVSRIDPH